MYIRNYLEKQGIKYKAEYKLENLFGDEKSYRKVDFISRSLKYMWNTLECITQQKLLEVNMIKRPRCILKTASLPFLSTHKKMHSKRLKHKTPANKDVHSGAFEATIF